MQDLLRIGVFVSTFCCGLSAKAADDPLKSAILAHFKFNQNLNDESNNKSRFQSKNLTFQSNALYLNGQYEHGKSPKPFRAVANTPKLDYDSFTVALRVQAETFEGKNYTIFMGGTGYRWFGLSRSRKGNLAVTLNQRVFYEFPEATIHEEEWMVIACGVDLPKKELLVYLNGKKVGQIDLPKDFKFEVATSKAKERDKVWTFTNYSNGTAFHGLADELIIYNRMLTANEFRSIPLTP